MSQKDYNFYFSSGKIRNDLINKNNFERNKMANSQARPFSSTRILRKKNILK